jgi:hypothetical protein
MNLGFIPKGNYSFKELLELVVKQKFGEKTAKPITVDDDIEYNSSIWSKDWESAREIIRQALEVGTLTAWLRNSKGEEDRIPKSDWAIPEGDSHAYSYATLSYGTLQHGDRRLIGTVVYVRSKEADAFLIRKTKVSPSLDTRKAKEKHLHEAYVALVERKIKKNKSLRSNDILKDSDLKLLIKESDLPKGCPAKSTLLRKWIPEARNNTGISAPIGRPKMK